MLLPRDRCFAAAAATYTVAHAHAVAARKPSGEAITTPVALLSLGTLLVFGSRLHCAFSASQMWCKQEVLRGRVPQERTFRNLCENALKFRAFEEQSLYKLVLRCSLQQY